MLLTLEGDLNVYNVYLHKKRQIYRGIGMYRYKIHQCNRINMK